MKTKREMELIRLLEQYRTIASEAISLADAYAGGESETVQALNESFEEADETRNKLLNV